MRNAAKISPVYLLFLLFHRCVNCRLVFYVIFVTILPLINFLTRIPYANYLLDTKCILGYFIGTFGIRYMNNYYRAHNQTDKDDFYFEKGIVNNDGSCKRNLFLVSTTRYAYAYPHNT